MAEQYVGSQILGAIVDEFRAWVGLTDVQVERGHPGDAIQAECIYAGEIVTDVDVPVMTAGPKNRDQIITIPFEVRVGSTPADLDTTEARLGQILGEVDQVLATKDTLDDFDSVISADLVDIRQITGGTPEGYLGFAEFTLQIHTRVAPT